MDKLLQEDITYCSLDIETSDFDPSVGEILELGMVFFKIEKTGIKLIKEWTSTFKTSKEVPLRILALTGITMEELENSVQFREKYDEINALVNNCTIVGHNINFDIKFLEGFGIRFSGKVIDTLDLAQIFLPTSPSYNLESLMGFLQVDHKDAHRALADSRAAIVVLEKLLQHYASFPAELKRELIKLYPPRGNHEITALLETEFQPQPIVERVSELKIADSPEIANAIKENKTIICFPLGFDYYSYVYGALRRSKEKLLLIVPTKRILFQLWKQGEVQAYFENSELFDGQRFEANLRKRLTKEKRLFFAKMLVWKFTNWQARVLADLNFSFFGNQYKSLVSYDNDEPIMSAIDSSAKVAAFDYFSFIKTELDPSMAKRKSLILDINNFEQAITLASSKKVSWNDFIYALKQAEDIPEAQQALADIDLFFGLASMNWKKINSASTNILIDDAVRNREEYAAIEKAAQSFCEKMLRANKELGLAHLSQYVSALQSFFGNDPKQVRWVEIFENRLVFYTSPIDLDEISEQKLKPFKKILFTASLGSDSLIRYFTGRLHLHDFSVVTIGQQELRKKFSIVIPAAAYSPETLLGQIKKLAAPAAVLLPGTLALKEFYENNFRELQQSFKVFAQGYSGGTNKLLGNFAMAPNGLLLCTDRFLLKQIGKSLKVKSLVITRLPFEQFNHPLFAVQAAKYQNQFIDFNIPRALYNFHAIIRFFYSEDLETMYILDQKIHKEYGKYFIEYLKSLPFIEIID